MEGCITVGDVITIGEYSGEVESSRCAPPSCARHEPIVIPNGFPHRVNQADLKVALWMCAVPIDSRGKAQHAVWRRIAKAAREHRRPGRHAEVMGFVDSSGTACCTHRASCAVKENGASSGRSATG
jgi:hypothetical protein